MLKITPACWIVFFFFFSFLSFVLFYFTFRPCILKIECDGDVDSASSFSKAILFEKTKTKKKEALLIQPPPSPVMFRYQFHSPIPALESCQISVEKVAVVLE